MSINRVTLDGYIGQGPEIRTMNNGNKVAAFRMATSETWKDAGGEKKERTEWHSIVCFSEWMIEVIEKKLRKGSRVLVEGMLATREWEKDDVKRYTTEIIVRGGNSIILPVNWPKSERGAPPHQGDPRQGGGGDASARERASAAVRGDNALDDDVPF